MDTPIHSRLRRHSGRTSAAGAAGLCGRDDGLTGFGGVNVDMTGRAAELSLAGDGPGCGANPGP